MTTQAEDLPNELWLPVFSYLEAHDLFYSFGNLNHRFNRLLASNYLRFYVELIKQNNDDEEYTATTILWLGKILKRIVCLQLKAESGFEDIPNYLHDNAHKLVRLKSLTIKITKYQTYIIYRLLQKLRSLVYLSVTCTKTPFLIESIFDLPNLRVLQLNTDKSEWYNWHSFKVNTNIEVFSINFQGLSDYRMTNILLAKMPNLKRFEISGYGFDCRNLEKLFAKPVFNLPQLRTIKFVGGSEFFLSSYLKSLQRTMPSLQRLHMDVHSCIMNESQFNHLVYYWWPLFEKLENIYIKIKGYISKDFPTQSDYYWKILLEKNKASDNRFRIEWKSYFGKLPLIKITIKKPIKKNR